VYSIRKLICLVALLVALFTQPVLADRNGGQGNVSPSPNGNGVDVTASDTSQAQAAGGTGSTGVTCNSMPIPVTGLGQGLAWVNSGAGPFPNGGGIDSNGNLIAPGTPGTWYLVTCSDSAGTIIGTPNDVVFAGQGRPVDPAQLALEARNHLNLPGPAVQLSPSADHWQYTQMPTWAWLPQNAWAPLTASASAGAVTVTVTATPVRLSFSYQTSGDGTIATATCNGSGTPYSDQLAQSENPDHPVLAASPDCGWTWHRSSADTPDRRYAVTAHILYHVTWTAAGAPGGGVLGDLPGADATFRLPVGEIQAVNTSPR
jgi:hypothetical protein